jgi:hypothetical protein
MMQITPNHVNRHTSLLTSSQRSGGTYEENEKERQMRADQAYKDVTEAINLCC